MKKLLTKLVNLIRHKVMGVDDRSSVQIAIDNGLTVGKNFSCKEGSILDPGHVFLITIGANVTLAPRVHLLAHDASTKRALGYTKIAPLTIGNDVFIGANTTVMPGVTIGNNVIIGANALVSSDIPSNSVCVGNPARVIKTTDEYFEKYRNALSQKPVFDESYIITNITPEKREQMKKELAQSGFGFIV